MKSVVHAATFASFRDAARTCLAQDIKPCDVRFASHHEAQASLFGAPSPDKAPAPQAASSPHTRLPRAFVKDAEHVAMHTDPGRWDLLYRLVWRLTHGEPRLLEVSTDDDVLLFVRLYRAVHRDVHKCHAYVRFRAVPDETAHDKQHWVAWYKPAFLVLPLAVPHFIDRFGQMAWSIMTPDASVTHRDGQTLFTGGCPKPPAETSDAIEALWRTYYTHIFNPARLNRRAMQQEMPRRYWGTMPETELIDGLIRDAPKRTQAFFAAQPQKAASQLHHEDVPALARALAGCRICDWCQSATQVVAGEGPPRARVILVGEQPGDEEDVRGRPFVGPAGQLLDRALAEAGLIRADVYVTNAVKHFKWTPRGKKRLHQKPNPTDVAACRPWLAGEIKLVAPEWLVCLGTTAALAVLGKAVLLKDVRGRPLKTAACAQTLCTTHPSAVLRTAPEAQKAAFSSLVQDLRTVAQALNEGRRQRPAPL